MPKQRLKKLFKSFIDPEKDEQLKGTKSEIDGKWEKIFEFVKRNGNDGKESVADLIEDFRNHYESIYARYDNLSEELRKKFHGSSSSSSDSDDSDVSPRKKGKRNGKVEHSVEKNIAVVEHELETALIEVNELKSKVSAAIDEKEALNLEYQSALRSKNEDVSQLEEVKRELEIRNSEMEKALIEKENEITTLQKKYDDGESEKCAQIAADVNSLNEQLGFLGEKKKEADAIVEKQGREISEFLNEIEKLREELSRAENKHTELVNKIVEQEQKMKEQDEAFEKLSEEHKKLEVQFKNCEESVKSSETEIEQLKDQFRKIIDAKNQDIDQLEETIEDLKTDLEIKQDEMNTLVENMRTTEVKQRLTSQKLRITEQLLGENEEDHRKRVEKLQEEQKLLEERIALLLEIISTYKEAQVKLVNEITEKMNVTLMGIDTFSVKFEEDYSHLESRVYEIANELKVVMNWITGNNAEKDQLKKDIASLLQQLKDKMEQELLLTVKTGELERMLQNDEAERKSLIETVKKQEEKMGELEKVIEERDEKMGELERKVNEKDSGILSLSEEKREAIRQLCIWIDYHHNRYDNLKDMILKARGGRRQIAA